MNDLFQALSTNVAALQPIIPSRFERFKSDPAPTLPTHSLESPEPNTAGAPRFDDRSPAIMRPIPSESNESELFDDARPLARHQEPSQPILSNVADHHSSPLIPTEPRRNNIPSPLQSDEVSNLARRVEEIGRELRGSQARQEPPVARRSGAPRSGAEQTWDEPTVGNNPGFPHTVQSALISPIPTNVPPRIIPERVPSLDSAPSNGSVVNVTIGRVEVKAHKDTTPQPSRPAATARVMSLEQYLQRRRAGAGV